MLTSPKKCDKLNLYIDEALPVCTRKGGFGMAEQKIKRLSVRLTEDTYAKLKAIAEAQQLTMSDVLRQWVLRADDPRKKKEE